MHLDLSRLLNPEALSDRPHEILKGGERRILSALMETILLEAADRDVREKWQASQVANIVRHAHARSAFWRSRLTPLPVTPNDFARLPALTRQDLIRQVETEGSLIQPHDGLKVHRHRTSGSSGTPVQFFVTDANENYNIVRTQMQSVLTGQVQLSRMRFRAEFSLPDPGFELEQKERAIGETGRRGIFRPVDAFVVRYGHFKPRKLLKAIAKLQVPVWISSPGFIEVMLSYLGAEDLHRAGLRHWLCMSGRIPDDVRAEITSANIEIHSSYSSEEIGSIGAECREHPHHYHVSASNVVVHPSKETIVHDGVACNRILVTHLHAYATPLIKYDLGDLGRVLHRCPCGFDGQTIADLAGRVSGSLVHADGRRSAFIMQNRKLVEIGGIKQYRARQVDYTKVIVDVVPEGDGSAIRERLHSYLQTVAGPGIEVELRFCEEIDWGGAAKRLGFRSEIA